MRLTRKQKIWLSVAAVLVALGVIGALTDQSGQTSTGQSSPTASTPAASRSSATVARPTPTPSAPAAARPAFVAWLRDQGFATTSWGRTVLRVDANGRILTYLYPKDSNQDAALMVCRVYVSQYDPEHPVVMVKASDQVTTLAHYAVLSGKCEKG